MRYANHSEARWRRCGLLGAAALLVVGCTEGLDYPGASPLCRSDVVDCDAPDWPPNVLLIIADDVGIDLVGAYDAGGEPPPTPTLDALAANGIRFDHAYAYPWCSPTRVALLTGHAHREFGIGRAIRAENDRDASLPLAADTLPKLLDTSPQGWSHALIGKWHLSTLAEDPHDAPLRHGFDRFVGSFANLYARHAYDGEEQSYYDWERSEDGDVARSRTYVTTQNVNDALDVIDTLQEPWLTWLAFPAAHDPWNPPPEDLHGYGPLDDDAEMGIRYRAIVEAMDREIGRLLASMDPATRARTLIVFVGDNGTTRGAMRGPFEGAPAKGTVYEPGVHVPLIVSGAAVAAPGRRVEGLVRVNDLFATLLDLADVDPGPLAVPARSFARGLVDPQAEIGADTVFIETFAPNGDGPWDEAEAAMARDHRFKLIEEEGTEALYDLEGRLVEGEPLDLEALTDEQAAARDRLRTALTRGRE